MNCPFCGAENRRPGCLWWPKSASEFESRRTDSCYEHQIAALTAERDAARQELADCKERLVLWREFEREMEIIVDNGIHITLLIPAKTIDKLKDLGEI